MKFLTTSINHTEKENLKCLTRKHIAERQRRARINLFLEQLETLILPEDSEPSPVKLEKAEVLEKTVEYIKRRRTSERQGSRSDYEKGYKECLRNVFNFVDGSNLSPYQKNNIRACLLSQQATNDQPVETPLSESSSQQRQHRLPQQYLIGSQCAPAQYIKQEVDVMHCNTNNLDIIPQYQIQVSPKHISTSPVQLQVSPVSYQVPNIQSSVSHFQLPMTQTFDLPSTTSGRHMQIMNSGTTPFCDQSSQGIADSNVWRPW
ncbi:protein hairy-like [Ylistrum balloti]|uniref:protein hairy-like n=1 Tax=Ylistrum balloti TaxID=509963 RepID=UPI002905A5E3|nr:protein hairy-like [Ylistrum balloti]